MQLKIIAILIILMSSGCASNPDIKFSPVVIPAKSYVGTVKKQDILQCPDPVRKSIYRHLKARDQYIEILIEVMTIHNGAATNE